MLEILKRNIRENAREYAIRVLYHNIINMNLEPGQQISESEISKTLGISRTPVREALIELSKLSLVEIYPQRGTYISKIDMEKVEESRFARCVLEKAVVKLACRRLDDKYKAKIEENLKRQEISAEKKDFQHLLMLDNQFHELIFKACDKEMTYHFIRSMMSHFDRVRILNFVKMDMNRTVNDHKKIFAAIVERDEIKSEELMEEHLTRVVFDQEYLKTLHPEYFK